MTVVDNGNRRTHGVIPLATPDTRVPLEHPDDPLAATDITNAAALFKALGDPIRVQLLALVRKAPTGEACFCDLADEFDMPQSSLSHHLKILVKAGVLSRERRGTWSWYRAEHQPLETIQTLLRPGGPLREPPPNAEPPPLRGLGAC